jgi:hypothetical protein
MQKWDVLQHLLHSPDPAPSDFYLSEPLKNYLSRKRFEDQNVANKNSCAILHIPWKGTLQ